jgi:hypothetical protein
MDELAKFQDGCLAVVAGIVIFGLGFAIGYAFGRAEVMY